MNDLKWAQTTIQGRIVCLQGAVNGKLAFTIERISCGGKSCVYRLSHVNGQYWSPIRTIRIAKQIAQNNYAGKTLGRKFFLTNGIDNENENV